MKATISSSLGLIVLGALLFIPAGTFRYWQGWVFIAVFSTVTIIPAVYLGRTDPAALERRMHAGPTAESRPIQKIVMVATTLVFGVSLIIPALDYRLGWSHVPTVVSIIGDVVVAVGLGLTMLVVIQNRYASATITVEKDQPLVTTGLYGLVRHPMYGGAVIMMAGTPLALGSYWALLVLIPGIALLCIRIHDEEKMLVDELAGYPEYTQTVRYRMLPLIW